MNASGASGSRALGKFNYRTSAGIAAGNVGPMIEVVQNAGLARKVARLRPMGVIKGCGVGARRKCAVHNPTGVAPARRPCPHARVHSFGAGSPEWSAFKSRTQLLYRAARGT